MSIQRCQWAGTDELYVRYHDEEWGVPVHDDRRHFEMVCLEGAQAGLSWITILRKRENYRRAFDGFDPSVVAGYGEDKIAELLDNPGIVRNKLKVRAFVRNAQAFLRTQAEFGSFDAYIWRFVGGAPLVNHWQSMRELPARTPQAEAMSKDLLKRNFTFVGPTICYAYMQACGMVNDHEVGCFRHQEIARII
jgi:DNA-3-methyladenine glycosylase I